MELIPKKRLQLFAGRSHPGLARDIAAHLGVELGEANLSQFANGEIHCRFGESIRGSDAFIIQTHCGPVNDSIMEQLIMIDAAKRASAKRITAVCPFYGYSRQDRKAAGREPITAKLRGQHAHDRRRRPGGERRPALGPDPGLLRRPRRPPHGHARARRLRHRQPGRRRGDRVARRGPGEDGRALRPARPHRGPGHGPQAADPGRGQPGGGPRRWWATSPGGCACWSTT